MSIRQYWIWLLCCGIGLQWGCDECDPAPSTGNVLIMRFLAESATDGYVTVPMDTSLSQVLGVGAEIQSLAAVDTVNDWLYLSLDLAKDSSVFLIRYTNPAFADDTLVLKYDRLVRTNPPNCSLIESIVNLRASGTFDSIMVSKPIIDREADENVVVFLDL